MTETAEPATSARPAAPATPASGDARVCAAVALGWQMATLYHSPVHRGPVKDPARSDRLPGRSAFCATTRTRWLAEQIAATSGNLLHPVPDQVADGLARVLGNLGDADRDRDTTMDSIFFLHCRLLEAFTVTDFRLGKAYGLGRALAETALIPAGEAGDPGAEFTSLLDQHRIDTIKDWLVELKTMLPDHAAYAVNRGLDDWCNWAAGPRQPGDWTEARSYLRVQGYLWRGLITGEKSGTDMLSLAGYLTAARQIIWRTVVALWWLILIAAGAVVGLLLWHSISPTARLFAILVSVGGTIAAGLKAAGSLLGSAAEGAEGWLWQTELDESVATAATHLPPRAPRRHPPGRRAGTMTFSPAQAAPDGGTAGLS